ncbi:MAG: dockerin type I repeat-containing protein [Planctomycetota bacterium]
MHIHWKYWFVLLVSLLSTNSQSLAQTVLVERPSVFPADVEFGELSQESNRFGNFSGYYPADHFVVKHQVTLDKMTAFGALTSNSFNQSSIGGWTVQIFNDDNGMPGGFAFADVFSGGNFGSDGVVYLPAIDVGAGAELLVNEDNNVTVEIDFTTANEGLPITLPPGEYWMSISVRTPFWHPGDPSGSWAWLGSVGSPDQPQRVEMYRSTFDNVGIWEPIGGYFSGGEVGDTFAWTLTATDTVLLGDVNLDGEINLLDVAPFVELLANGGFQNEADLNQDGVLNLLDVASFVDALAGL